MMNDQVGQLIVVLETLENQYQQLLSVMGREKEATMKSNAGAMNLVVSRKQELMAAMAGMERQRRGLLQQIALQLGMPVTELKLSMVAEHTDDVQASKLNRLSASMAKLLDKVQKANDENRALIQHCLGLVESTLGFFQRWLAPASVYGNGGKIDDGPLNGKLLSGIV